jgi:hypothetical protein
MDPTVSLDALNKKPSLLLKGTKQRRLGRPRHSLVTVPNAHVTKLNTFSVTERRKRRHKTRKYLHYPCETSEVRGNTVG